MTLLDKIGGKASLYIVVDLFYDEVLRDSRVSHFFKYTNMVH